jgi:hypothetical protein
MFEPSRPNAGAAFQKDHNVGIGISRQTIEGASATACIVMRRA